MFFEFEVGALGPIWGMLESRITLIWMFYAKKWEQYTVLKM
jgi:hypothetical protein